MRLILAALVIALGPTIVLAETGNTPEMHRIAAATFNVACIANAPDLAASNKGFVEAGLQEESAGVYKGHRGQIVGITKESADGKTRTCAVGLVLGVSSVLMSSLDEMTRIVWRDEFQTVENAVGNPVLIKQHDSFVGAMTVTIGDDKVPLMNYVAISPDGNF